MAVREGKFYGENKHVYLKDEEYTKLLDRYGEEYVADIIGRMDEYCELTGKRYKKYVLAINNWAKREKDKLKSVEEEQAKKKKAMSDYERYKTENKLD